MVLIATYHVGCISDCLSRITILYRIYCGFSWTHGFSYSANWESPESQWPTVERRSRWTSWPLVLAKRARSGPAGILSSTLFAEGLVCIQPSNRSSFGCCWVLWAAKTIQFMVKKVEPQRNTISEVISSKTYMINSQQIAHVVLWGTATGNRGQCSFYLLTGVILSSWPFSIHSGLASVLR